MKDSERLVIDARGRSCPEPVLMTKHGIEKSVSGIDVIVDNATAMENIKRFAQNSGYKIEISEQNVDYILKLRK